MPEGSIIAMPFFRSGEQVKAGDRVRLHGEPGEIESVHDPVKDPDDWFIKMCGAGAMIAEESVRALVYRRSGA